MKGRRKYERVNLSLNEFVLKLVQELNTVAIKFPDSHAAFHLRTCSLRTCNKQFWTRTESSKRYPTCSEEHAEEQRRILNATRQKRYQRATRARRKA